MKKVTGVIISLMVLLNLYTMNNYINDVNAPTILGGENKLEPIEGEDGVSGALG